MLVMMMLMMTMLMMKGVIYFIPWRKTRILK